MAKFTVNSTRFDPYLGFKFKVKVDGQYVAGLNKCSALKKTTEVTPWYEGGDASGPHQIPGKSKYDPITLEAGVTHDTTFEEWANKVNNFQGDASMSLATFRKEITIEVDGDLSRTDWEQPARFARLNRRYGRRGLALLEAILRQSDWVASARSEAGREGSDVNSDK